MATKVMARELKLTHVTKQEQFVGSAKFDALMLISCFWLLSGGYLDAWAHNHIRLETFFTPWHAVLYSGLLCVLVFHSGALIINHMRGYSWRHALPAGYGLTLLGIIGFAVGGVADMLWHIIFGIELSIDGALSPTHLALAGCITLVVSGPFRAAWHRASSTYRQGFVLLLPMIISFALTLSSITLISQLVHPFVFFEAAGHTPLPQSEQVLGVTSIILQSLILMGFLLFAMRRWALPFGTVTIVFTLNLIYLSFMQDHYLQILAGTIAGLVADVLIWRLRPSVLRSESLRFFAFIVPVVLYLMYFLSLELTEGIYWSIHLWLGSTIVAGVFGWLLSYIFVPPHVPVAAEEYAEE